MFEPAKLSCDLLDGVDVDARRGDVGTQPVQREHRRREQRASGGCRGREGVENRLSITAPEYAGAAGRLDLLPGGGAETVGLDRQLLGDLAPGEDLDRVGARRQPAPERLRGDLGAGVEARLEIGEVDRLRAVRNCSNGIDFFICGPRSLRIRMWIGFCPPS